MRILHFRRKMNLKCQHQQVRRPNQGRECALVCQKKKASDVTCTFWENYNKRFRHKFQSSQGIESSQMRRQDDEKQKGKQDEKRI